jgi:16S rRNA (adenine1518-N6/adenine1519-N6)-dimethyltransferase
MVIKGSSFYPRPNVDSQGILLELREDAAFARPAIFYPLVRQLFCSRRKTIKNNLSHFLTLPIAQEALEKSALNGNRRAEDLSFEDFTVLAKTIEAMRLS